MATCIFLRDYPSGLAVQDSGRFGNMDHLEVVEESVRKVVERTKLGRSAERRGAAQSQTKQDDDEMTTRKRE